MTKYIQQLLSLFSLVYNIHLSAPPLMRYKGEFSAPRGQNPWLAPLHKFDFNRNTAKEDCKATVYFLVKIEAPQCNINIIKLEAQNCTKSRTNSKGIRAHIEYWIVYWARAQVCLSECEHMIFMHLYMFYSYHYPCVISLSE